MKKLKIAEIQAENQSRHLLSTSLKCYHYTCLLCPFISARRIYYQGEMQDMIRVGYRIP